MSSITIISPLFSFLLYAYVVAVVASIDYPNQKYVLFKKLPDGRIRKVETFTEPISKDQAVSMYGQDRYMLQSMKPRTKVIWKDLSPSATDRTENKTLLIELQPLERKTKYLTAGLVGLGVGTAIGFGATAVSFLNNNQLLNRAAIAIDSLLSSYPIPGFLCGTCASPLLSIFDKYCNQCGYPITSPERRQLALPSDQRCPKCSFPLRLGQLYCRECGRSLQNESSRRGWSLP
jgi:hypothetical protein